MSAVTSFSRTASNNNSAAPDGFPEGQTAGSVNNCARELMKAIVDEATNNACKVLASVAGTNTITASLTPDITAYSAHMLVVFTPANTNTGATTLNIDSVGALDVLNVDGTACVGGELVAGIPSMLLLDTGGDDWIITNPVAASKRLVNRLITGVTTTAATDAGRGILAGGAGAYTVTVENLSTYETLIIYNISGAAITIAPGAGITLDWFDGSGTIKTGNRTLAVSGQVFLTKADSTNLYMTGVGIT